MKFIFAAITQLPANPNLASSPICFHSVLFAYFIVLPFLTSGDFVNSLQSFIFALLGFSCFIFGYYSRVRLKIKNFEISPTKDGIKLFFFFLFLSADAIKIICNLVTPKTQILYSELYRTREIDLKIYLLLLSETLYFLKMYIYSSVLYKKRGIFFVAFFLSAFLAIGERARFNLIREVIFFGIYGYHSRFLTFSWLKFFSIAIFAPFLMLAALIKRDLTGVISLVSVTNSVFENLSEMTTSGNLWARLRMAMETFSTFEIYKNVINDNFVSPFNGFLRIFANAFPRQFWENKPLPIQVILAQKYNPSAYENGGGIFANIYGDAYLNGGIAAIILIMLFLGWTFSAAYRAVHNQGKTNSLNLGFYSICVCFFCNAYRGYFSDLFWNFLLFVLTFKLCNLCEKQNFNFKWKLITRVKSFQGIQDV